MHMSDTDLFIFMLLTNPATYILAGLTLLCAAAWLVWWFLRGRK